MHGKHKLTVPLIVITKKIEASLSIRKNFVYLHKLSTIFLCDSPAPFAMSFTNELKLQSIQRKKVE